jgi:predicted transcriptional regulator
MKTKAELKRETIALYNKILEAKKEAEKWSRYAEKLQKAMSKLDDQMLRHFDMEFSKGKFYKMLWQESTPEIEDID